MSDACAKQLRTDECSRVPYTLRSTLYLMTAVARYLRGLFFLAMIMFVCFHDNSMHLLAERLRFRLHVQLLGIHPPSYPHPCVCLAVFIVRSESTKPFTCLSAKFRQSTTRSEARYETEDRRVAPCAHKKKDKKKRHAMSHDSI